MGAAWRKHCRASSLAAASEFFKLVQKDMQVLISAPAAVVPQWHEECCRILEAGWETWLQALSCDTREPLPTVDLIILDEAHHLKNSATKNEPRLARHYGVKLALTGSPKAPPNFNSYMDFANLLVSLLYAGAPRAGIFPRV